MDSIEARISTIVSNQFVVEGGSVEHNSTFLDLGFNSMNLMTLGLVLEDEFDVALEDELIGEEMTVADIAELIRNRTATSA